MAVIYTDEVDKKHTAPLWSKATCITVGLVILMITLPLIFVVRTHSKLTYSLTLNPFFSRQYSHIFSFSVDFWVVDTFHYEQPDVTHLNELVAIVQTDTETIQVGTTKELNTLLSGTHGSAGSIDI